MKTSEISPGVIIGEKVENAVVYTMDDDKNPIIFKDEKEAIDYLIDCGVKQSMLENFIFLKEVINATKKK